VTVVSVEWCTLSTLTVEMVKDVQRQHVQYNTQRRHSLVLDIGRYELSSGGSSVVLHIDAKVSANSGKVRFTKHVITGTREQCLAGDLLTIFVVSAVVTALIFNRALHGHSLMIGGGALTIEALITSISFLI